KNLRRRFDKIVWNDFEHAQHGPEGVKGRMPGIILPHAPYLKTAFNKAVFLCLKVKINIYI
ncbi:hypothetical protein, partial [Aliiglaciecola lipolytica]|uniref:hypothetical protein n=1 Tax=Aliiglaciecola lipolytica TaxID=477689 RepID=UPI00058E4907